MNHSGPHRDAVLPSYVLAEADLAEGAEAAHGHGKVDALAGDMLQGADVFKCKFN